MGEGKLGSEIAKSGMYANSRIVQSNQDAPHPRLHEIVSRHLHMPYRRVPSDAGRRAFESVVDRLREPFVLDAGCGTGASTLTLAARFPQMFVLGVDKSATRLVVGQRLLAKDDGPRNAFLLHCELVDFWQLAAAAGLRCARQYLLYPNPWPKAEQLKRRWHAHAVFADMLKLGGLVELRTNWRIYADEFVQALHIAGCAGRCAVFAPSQPLSPFERKYGASGHELRCCSADLSDRAFREGAA